MTEERLLGIGEVAERLHVSRSMVYLLVATGALPSLTIRRSRRVTESALGRFIEEREAASRLRTNYKKAASDANSETAVEAGQDATDLRE